MTCPMVGILYCIQTMKDTHESQPLGTAPPPSFPSAPWHWPAAYSGINLVDAPLTFFEKLLENMGFACEAGTPEKTTDGQTRLRTPRVVLALSAGTIPIAFWCRFTRS